MRLHNSDFSLTCIFTPRSLSAACRHPQGEITEGSESEIRAAFFVLAVTRDVDPATGALAWRVVEMSMQNSMLYL